MTHAEQIRDLVTRVLAKREARLASVSQISSSTRIAPSVTDAAPDGVSQTAQPPIGHSLQTGS